MNPRVPTIFVIVVFLGLLACPPLLQVVIEARRGDWPSALRVFRQRPTPENLRGYEKMLQDTSVTARTLRPKMQAVQFFALREPGGKALLGPNGWLFYEPGVSCLTQRARPSDSTAADAVAAASHFRDELAARGIHLIVMPVPNKESIYPDQLVRGAAPPVQPLWRESRSFLAGCRVADVEVVDLFALYAAARSTSDTLLYLEQDSHWTPAGMKMAASAVAARLLERDYVTKGNIPYYAHPAPIEEIGDLVLMSRSPEIEACVPPQAIAAEQVVRSDTGATFASDPSPEVLVLGDSFLRIYERDAPGGAGFVAHLALALARPVAGIISDGGASTLVRQDLYRRPKLLARAKVVVWEFTERDLRLGTEGWQNVPLPPVNVESRASARLEKTK